MRRFDFGILVIKLAACAIASRINGNGTRIESTVQKRHGTANRSQRFWSNQDRACQAQSLQDIGHLLSVKGRELFRCEQLNPEVNCKRVNPRDCEASMDGGSGAGTPLSPSLVFRKQEGFSFISQFADLRCVVRKICQKVLLLIAHEALWVIRKLSA